MKVRCVAKHVPSGINNTIMLEIQDGGPAVADFLRYKHKVQETDGKERWIDCVFTTYYRARSLKQNALQWELCNRIALADHVAPETVHQAMKELVYPKEEYYGTWVPKEGKELSTAEYSHAIDWLIMECLSRPDPVEISDIWILFTEWRYAQGSDPLEYKYTTPEAYRESHPLCEVCGDFLLGHGPDGSPVHRGHLSHLVTLGSTGIEYAPWLVIMACPKHHAQQHTEGWGPILKIAPWVEAKQKSAYDKLGTGNAPAPLEGDALAEVVLDVFKGEVVEGTIKAHSSDVKGSTIDLPPENGVFDPVKSKMLKSLEELANKASEYYPKSEPQKGLFDEPPAEPEDFKAKQYKDSDDDEEMIY